MSAFEVECLVTLGKAYVDCSPTSGNYRTELGRIRQAIGDRHCVQGLLSHTRYIESFSPLSLQNYSQIAVPNIGVAGTELDL